ncbi:MAG: VOC family protein [Bdellovibrionota bacterium]
MNSRFKSAVPYCEDALNLPVANVDAALPFYEGVMGFRVLGVSDTSVRSVILHRDDVQIGLAENGGDPTQEGCFFEVEDVQATFEELRSRGLEREEPGFRMEWRGPSMWKIFFVIAPDGLCYCLGERQPSV